MTKKLFFVLVVAIVLSLVSISAFAGPPEEVSGRWCYEVTVNQPVKLADGNAFVDLDDNGAWIGTIEGFSSDDGRLIAHHSGYLHFKSVVSFASPVTIGDQEFDGTLQMRVNGRLPVGGDISEYEGTWVITRTSGELSGLTGQGTWGGVEIGNIDCLAVDQGQYIFSVPYWGKINLPPN